MAALGKDQQIACPRPGQTHLICHYFSASGSNTQEKRLYLECGGLRLIMVRDIEYEILYCNSLSLVVIALWWLIHALTGAATKG